MTVNFEIEESIALRLNGKYIDLHNNFDFSSYDYQPQFRLFTLNFLKSNGDWIKEDEFERLIFVHTDVFFLSTHYDNKQYEFPANDICLADITFFPASNRDINDRIILQNKPDEGDDILYIFQSEHFIRIGCDKIELIT